MYGFDQFFECRSIMAVPFRWDPRGTSPQIGQSGFFRSGQSGFKRLPSGDAAINCMPALGSMQRMVGKVPFHAVEAVTLVNTGGTIESLCLVPAEHRLPAIAI